METSLSLMPSVSVTAGCEVDGEPEARIQVEDIVTCKARILLTRPSHASQGELRCPISTGVFCSSKAFGECMHICVRLHGHSGWSSPGLQHNMTRLQPFCTAADMGVCTSVWLYDRSLVTGPADALRRHLIAELGKDGRAVAAFAPHFTEPREEKWFLFVADPLTNEVVSPVAHVSLLEAEYAGAQATQVLPLHGNGCLHTLHLGTLSVDVIQSSRVIPRWLRTQPDGACTAIKPLLEGPDHFVLSWGLRSSCRQQSRRQPAMAAMVLRRSHPAPRQLWPAKR